MEEILKVLDSSLSRMNWRLRSSARLRLEIDILALCTGMRAVIMIDYGGMMPTLQHNLCTFLKFCQEDSPAFEHLRVMIIEEMIYLVHVNELAEYVCSSLSSEAELKFVDLEQDPPKLITLTENSPVGMQLISVQKLFSLHFPLDGTNYNLVLNKRKDDTATASSSDKPAPSQSSEVVDLGSCLNETQVTVPTLNGWLLGYPVVYLFSKEHINDAIYNLSTKSLHIFRILICRNGAPKGSPPEELMSFTVPYELSMGGSKEPWAEMFLARVQSKWEKCKQNWKNLKMEVSECLPQAIAF